MPEAFKLIMGAALAMSVALGAGADIAHGENAQSTDLHWEQLPDQFTWVDSSDAGKEADFFGFSRTIQTAGTTGPLVVFLCHVSSEDYESLNVAIQLDPHSTYGENPERAPRILTLTGVLTVDGKKQSERFRYHPASSKIVPFDRTVSKRLYNAAVTGADVSIKVQGKTHDLEIPAKNDVFVSFAKVCPVTNGGTFDRSIFDGETASP
jgi:hypothetical protein